MSIAEMARNAATTFRDRAFSTYMRLPEHPMKYRCVSWLAKYAIPERGIVAQAHPGLTLRLHPRDWIEYLLLRGDRYEPLTLEFITRNLRSGDVAVLAGVNFGQHVVVAARAVGPEGRVVGVEPQPTALLRAAENIRLNNVEPRVQLVSAALGADDQFLPMAWPVAQNSGTANLLDEGQGVAVRVVRLSSVIETFCGGAPRLLLLDVEGFETHVLSGLSREHCPEIVVVEVEPRVLAKASVGPTTLFHAISSLGYELRDLNGKQLPSDASKLKEHNVVGFRQGVSVAWV